MTFDEIDAREYKNWSDEQKWQYLARHEKLGEVLVKFGKITLEDLEKLLKQQAETGQPIGQLVVANKLLTADEILDALNLQLQNDKVSSDSIQELKKKSKD